MLQPLDRRFIRLQGFGGRVPPPSQDTFQCGRLARQRRRDGNARTPRNVDRRVQVVVPDMGGDGRFSTLPMRFRHEQAGALDFAPHDDAGVGALKGLGMPGDGQRKPCIPAQVRIIVRQVAGMK